MHKTNTNLSEIKPIAPLALEYVVGNYYKKVPVNSRGITLVSPDNNVGVRMNYSVSTIEEGSLLCSILNKSCKDSYFHCLYVESAVEEFVNNRIPLIESLMGIKYCITVNGDYISNHGDTIDEALYREYVTGKVDGTELVMQVGYTLHGRSNLLTFDDFASVVEKPSGKWCFNGMVLEFQRLVDIPKVS